MSLTSRGETLLVENKLGTTPVKLVEDGEDGVDGLNVATVYIYQRTSTSSTPPGPTGPATYTFSTKTLNFSSGANGWLTEPPTTGDRFLWARVATAASRTDTDDITTGEWSDSKILTINGLDGVDGTSITGPDGSTVVNGTVFLKAAATPTPNTPTGSYNKTNNTYTFSGG